MPVKWLLGGRCVRGGGRVGQRAGGSLTHRDGHAYEEGPDELGDHPRNEPLSRVCPQGHVHSLQRTVILVVRHVVLPLPRCGEGSPRARMLATKVLSLAIFGFF